VGGELIMEPVEYGEPTMSYTNPLHIITTHLKKINFNIITLSEPNSPNRLAQFILSEYHPTHVYRLFSWPSLDLFKTTIQREKNRDTKTEQYRPDQRNNNIISTGQTNAITTSTVHARPAQ